MHTFSVVMNPMQNRLRQWDFLTLDSFSYGLGSKCLDLLSSYLYLTSGRFRPNDRSPLRDIRLTASPLNSCVPLVDAPNLLLVQR